LFVIFFTNPLENAVKVVVQLLNVQHLDIRSRIRTEGYCQLTIADCQFVILSIDNRQLPIGNDQVSASLFAVPRASRPWRASKVEPASANNARHR
jgi:cell division FtsZ-interacting protein ZapD